MSTTRRDTALAAAGGILVIIALMRLSTEVGQALGFIGLMLLAIAGLSQLASRGSSGPPDSGGPPVPPHHH